MVEIVNGCLKITGVIVFVALLREERRLLRAAFMITMIYLILMLLPVAAGARPPQGNWWDSEEVRESLQLTEEQVEKIKKIVTEARKEMMELRGEFDEKSKQLKNLMDIKTMRRSPEEEMGGLLNEVQTIRNRIEKASFIIMVRTLKILTDEQAAKLSDKQEEMRKRLLDKFPRKRDPQSKPPLQQKEGE